MRRWSFSDVEAPDPEPDSAPELLGHHLVLGVRCHIAKRDDRVGSLRAGCTTLDPGLQWLTGPDRTMDDEVVVTVDAAGRLGLEVLWDELSSTRFLRVPQLRDHSDGWNGSRRADTPGWVPGRLREFVDQLGVEPAFEWTDSPSESHTAS